ncbi:hypothetical protein GVN24_34995 [Rhizobium sp. CRIBSB]|nr:hypothetical protein [Rhizobium sp. CRIBSB]
MLSFRVKPALATLFSCAVLCLGFPANADGQVVLTFAAKRAEDSLGIPHSCLRITGTTESGEAIQRTFGYMPVEQSPLLALGDRVRGAVIDEPEAEIEWDPVGPSRNGLYKNR